MILPPPRSTLFPYTTLFRSLGGVSPFQLLDAFVQVVKRALLSRTGRFQQRRCIALAAVEAALWHVVEERIKLVVLFLRDRIILVIVTLGARYRQAKPDGSRSIDAIDDVGVMIFFGNRAPFEVDHVITIETAGDLL